jgi:beta-1,4-N-acetylglucosaminyltransferase
MHIILLYYMLGAGSIMECLDVKKMLIVCINDTLQNNHQSELAIQMTTLGYCVATTPSKLLVTLQQEFHSKIRAYPDPDFDIFPRYMKALMARGNT